VVFVPATSLKLVMSSLSAFMSILILTVVLLLLGCVVSRPVIGWRLPPSNSTQITDGCSVGHDGVGHDSCCVSDATSRHATSRRAGLILIHRFPLSLLFHCHRSRLVPNRGFILHWLPYTSLIPVFFSPPLFNDKMPDVIYI